LSYAWGDLQGPKFPILIGDQLLHVGENLFDGLLHLQSDNELVIWIDAICINQNSNSERNSQVKKMKLIYQNASKVIVWLGLASYNSPIAIDFVHGIYNNRENDDYPIQFKNDAMLLQRLEALSDLLARAYWRRTWIIQEILLAKDVVIHCGNDIIKGHELEVAQAKFESTSRYWELFDCSGLSITRRGAIVWQGPISFAKSKKGLHHKTFTVFKGLQQHRQKLASDPRDKVYGLMGLVDGDYHHSIDVEYSRTTVQVYTDLARYEILTSGRLDIIAWVNNEPLPGSPSWVPNWKAFEEFVGMSRPLPSDMAGLDFEAAGNTCAEYSFDADGQVLTVKCLHLGFAQTVSYQIGIESPLHWSHLFKDIIRSWQEIVENTLGDFSSREEAFWSVVVGQVDGISFHNNNNEPEPEFSRNFIKYVWEILDPASSMREANEQIQSAEHEQRLSDARIFLDNWASRASWRRFFITSNGVMGLAPYATTVGDIICVPFGCNSPIMVRAVGNHYIVLGDVFLDGYMNGEAIDEYEKGALKSQEFKLY
jgi:hypothetical protein